MTSTFASLEVRHSRPDEWLNELGLNVGRIGDNIVRLAVVTKPATVGDLNPNLKGWPDGDRPLHPDVKSRWLEAGDTRIDDGGRPQMMKLSAYCGLVNNNTAGSSHPDRWMARNTETSERELELVRLLSNGINDVGGLEIRTGGLHGEDPGWRAEEDIAAPQAQKLCITCIQPIHFSNEQWRHDTDGRAEVYTEAPCDKCRGTRVVEGRRGEERCRFCETSPGKRLTLSHLADPNIEGRLS